MDILNKEAWEQKALIKAGALSVSELMQETLARIELVNPKVNALVNILSKEACEKLDVSRVPSWGGFGRDAHGN